MKKFVRYQCSVCGRETAKVDLTKHFVIDKCTITKNCSGTLQILEYRNSVSMMPSFVAGIENWSARNVVDDATSSTTAFVKYSPYSGSGKQVVFMVPTATVESYNSVNVEFTRKTASVVDFKKFTFTFDAPFITIAGRETSGFKTLSYTENDQIDVYLNGVKLSVGTGELDYNTCFTSSSVPLNTIKFNTSVSRQVNNVVEIVIRQASQQESFSITCNRIQFDKNTAKSWAFGNVKSATLQRISAVQYDLFLLDFSNIEHFIVDSEYCVSLNVGNDAALILLASEPFSPVDRITSTGLIFSSALFNIDSLGEITVSAIQQDLYPPLLIETFAQEDKIVSNGIATSTAISSSTIIGPA